MAQSWKCPYCNRACTIGKTDVRNLSGFDYISEEYGFYRGTLTVIVCPNPECRQQTVHGNIVKCYQNGNPQTEEPPVYSWFLAPESDAKPYPEYIPQQLRDDYCEACLIRTKSPKASATLSRRCLQGMIRNFWRITKGRLVDEIDELKSKVDAGTWAAIDSLRQIGNIGAHMEKDVNLIIDVDPDEAKLLLSLIETLFEEWYVAKHDRDEKMKAIAKLATAKKTVKPTPAPPAPPTV
jgi:hypothetical protein